METQPSQATLPRLRLLGQVQITGEGTQPLSDREGAAARRLLVLLALEANPLTLDHLDLRLNGADGGSNRSELAAEVRRARSAISKSLGKYSELIVSPRAGETMLDERLIAEADLVLLYNAAASERWNEVEEILGDADDEPLGGVSEFSYVFGDGAGLLRMERLRREHVTRVAAIRERLAAVESADAPLARRRMRSTGLRGLVAVAICGTLALAVILRPWESTPPNAVRVAAESSVRRALVVDNRVTDRDLMRQDRTPASLYSRPDIYCGTHKCSIAGTNRESGQIYDAAICQTVGVRTTNGDDGDPADDANPRLFSSKRYYGVRLRNGTFGYLSEVWVRAADRGGLGLPSC